MQFDFDRFTTLAKLAYRHCDGEELYSFDDVLKVFRYYFETYELIFNEPHPMISINQIVSIIRKMPYSDDDEIASSFDYSPDDYEAMIDQHFATSYRNCDYNINHFFSGRIRALRFYEVCY